jgi:hypothetical protein
MFVIMVNPAPPVPHSDLSLNECNNMIRKDLRQTPEPLLGKPFQNYIYVAGKVGLLLFWSVLIDK